MSYLLIRGLSHGKRITRQVVFPNRGGYEYELIDGATIRSSHTITYCYPAYTSLDYILVCDIRTVKQKRHLYKHKSDERFLVLDCCVDGGLDQPRAITLGTRCNKYVSNK